MASPQIENGYTKISNEILDALCKTRINGEARQVLDFIIRKTYGFNKRKDRISLSQFEEGTVLDRKSVCRAINKLKNMKLIIVIPNEDGNTYQFQKNNDEWVVAKLPLGGGNSASGKIVNRGSGISANRGVAKLPHTKETITKDNYTKDISEQSSQEIPKIIKLFEEVNPSYEKFYGNRTQRAAADRLLKKYGFEKVAGIIKYLPIINTDRYAKGKSITPLQLEDNLALIINHYNQRKSKKPKVSIIS